MNAQRKRRGCYREPASPILADRNMMMYRDRMMGATIAALAAGYRLSRTHVHRIVAGVPVLFPKSRPSAKSRARPGRWLRFHRLKDEARALRKLGYSYGEIAERLGIARGSAFNWCRMVKMAELRGRAWLSHQQGRPKVWKRELLTRTRPPVMPLA